MNPEYREKLLAVLAKLDELVTEADAIPAAPGDAEIYAWMENSRKQLVRNARERRSEARSAGAVEWRLKPTFVQHSVCAAVEALNMLGSFSTSA